MRKKLLSRMRVRSESGFTLIEVIVAVVILTVVGMTAANFAVRSLVTSREMQQRAAAASLAQDQLEKLQSQISSNAETSGHAQSYFNAFVKNISKGGYNQVNSDLESVLPDFQNAVGGISVYNNGTIDESGVPSVEKIRKSDTDYTLYAVVAKCFRISDSMTLLTSMPSGTYTYLDLDKKTSVDDKALNSPADYVEGRFSDSSGKTYYPMLRLTVFAKWHNNSKSNDCIYSVTKLIDLSDDGKLN
ncbi:MAG: prepilin-type N-terminal cleavage/methylation domain-containing protein [Bifidobacteriaceae bacterium]|nr:prepilin-type N-terminal cleavage/methylation domain-containing protein [Bifidobacteriaceae bacterium]